ncbi:MAG: ABC transporter ATP-binding protein [Clostridiales bacterium]|nr:ABC transporter ATP-binding protein [Clostridiales bacterium]
MKNKSSVIRIIGEMIGKNPGLCFLLLFVIGVSICFSLLPPLVLERIVDTLTAGEEIALSIAVAYFVMVAFSGLLDAAKESMITAFGQKTTHRIRSVMSEKLKRLPSSYYVEREQGVTSSRFVNDVNTVENLFTSGIISMAADLCKLISILCIVFSKSLGLGLLLILATPLLFLMTRQFQKRMLKAQMENREAVGRTNQQIPETLKNMRTIRVLGQETYMLHRYGDTIEQSYRAQERSNFYDAVYSPIVVSVSSLLIGIVMAASAQSGTVQVFFGMTAGTAAAVIAYVSNFFGPLESIGMEIQNIQSAVAGVQRINEFLRETEIKKSSMETKPEESEYALETGCCLKDNRTAVRISHMYFRYHNQDGDIFRDFNLTVSEGESIILAGRTGAGKTTLVKLVAGLYHPQQGEVQIFGKNPESIPEEDKRKWFGYVEQQFRMIPGTVGDQVSLLDPRIREGQIRYALKLVGLGEIVESLPQGIHTPCTEGLLSQGQFQLLSIARAIAADPKILLLDEITANLDSETEAMVLSALRSASQNRTVISVSHRLYDGERDHFARMVCL